MLRFIKVFLACSLSCALAFPFENLARAQSIAVDANAGVPATAVGAGAVSVAFPPSIREPGAGAPPLSADQTLMLPAAILPNPSDTSSLASPAGARYHSAASASPSDAQSSGRALPRYHILPPGSSGLARPMLSDESRNRSTPRETRETDVSGRMWWHALDRGFVRGANSSDAVETKERSQLPNDGKLEPAGGAPKASEPRPAPPAAPTSIFSRTVMGFFSSFLVIQVIVEALALAVPQLTDPLTKGFFALGALSSISYGAYSLGSFVGGRWVQRLGIHRAYRTVLWARTLIWTAAAFLYDDKLQAIPFAPLLAIFSLDYFVHSIGRVAEQTLQIVWFKSSPVTSSRFGTFRDFVEYGTVFSTMLVGLLISARGFGTVFYAAPFMFLIAAVATGFVSLPKATSQETFSFTSGFKSLFGDPSLAKLFMGKILLNNFYYTLSYITAVAFGVFASHGNANLSTLIASALTGVYGIGAIPAMFVMTWIANRIEKRTKDVPDSEKAKAQGALYAKSAAGALKWAALGLLGAWLFCSQAQVASFIWPIFAVSPALVLIGLTAQVALNHIDTLMKARIPKDKASNIVSAERTITYLAYAASFILWGALFQFFLAKAFLLLGIYCMLSAGAYLRLSRTISKSQLR